VTARSRSTMLARASWAARSPTARRNGIAGRSTRVLAVTTKPLSLIASSLSAAKTDRRRPWRN
jgi:hypothetical protein